MVGLMSATQVPEANCAICGAPPFPECPHEGERLELALNQAWDRWIWTETIRCVYLYLYPSVLSRVLYVCVCVNTNMLFFLAIAFFQKMGPRSRPQPNHHHL